MSENFSNAKPRRVYNKEPDGVLLVDKPEGMTSHDVVGAVRRIFSIKKVGHGGTLDPAATGLLAILIGKGTKLSNQIMGGDKIYDGILRLGAFTTTQDAEGEITESHDPSNITREMLEDAISKFKGDIYQTPPMVSAIKVGGTPLYKLARKGEEIERKARLVHIYRFDITEFGIPDSTIRVKCTKGTYIRTLCHDVGTVLGCGAHLAGLRRIQSGSLSVDNAIKFESLKAMTYDDLCKAIIPITSF